MSNLIKLNFADNRFSNAIIYNFKFKLIISYSMSYSMIKNNSRPNLSHVSGELRI